MLLSQDPIFTRLPWWDGKKWANGTSQFVYSYPPYFHFLCNQAAIPIETLYFNQSILMPAQSVQIYNYNLSIL
jgi:hypothetical protein